MSSFFKRTICPHHNYKSPYIIQTCISNSLPCTKISPISCLSRPMKLHNSNFPTLCSTYFHMVLLFTVITILCLHLATSSDIPTNETDCLALLKFKESIASDPNGVLSSWNHSIQFCNWYGITCGCHHQRVTALELQGHKLHGTITPYVGNLTFLRAINLQNNSFYGEIPKEVGHLFRLQHLNQITRWEEKFLPT